MKLIDSNNLVKNIGQLCEMIEDKQIKYRDFLQINNSWKSKLIESILLGFPLPLFVLFENDVNIITLVDGEKRIKAIYDFYSDKIALTDLEILTEYNGKKYSDLDKAEQRIFNTHQLNIQQMGKNSNGNYVNEIYKRFQSK